MTEILPDPLVADMMLHDIRRENHAESCLGHQLTQHEILRAEVILDALDTADRVERRAPDHHGRAHRELHAFEQAGRQNALPERSVHP